MKAKDVSFPVDHENNSDDEKPIAKYTKEIELASARYPVYQNIAAVYLPANGPSQQFYSSQNLGHEGIVISGITQGVPVTNNDINAIRIASQSMSARRAYWNYRKKVQSFVCLNVFYVVVLIISINANFSDYREYKEFCPKFSKTNLYFGLLSIAWIGVGSIGVYGAVKRFAKVLRFYVNCIYLLILLTAIVTVLGLIYGEEGPECETEAPKSLIVIGNAIFTIVILILFVYSTSKLLRLHADIERHSQPNVPIQIQQANIPIPNIVQSDPIPIN